MTELENRALAFLQSHILYDECRDEHYKDKSDFELLADFAKQEISELEKENAELKEYNKYLKRKRQGGIQKQYNKVAIIKRQDKQLIKAKALLAKWVELYKPKSDTALPTPIQVDTEQFLNSEVEK